MAEEETAKLTLPKELRDNLNNLESDFEKADNAMASLEKLGMDTAELKDKLSWAKKTRDVLLKDFGE